MSKSIGSLALGSKIKDSNGNSFIVIAKNHYSSNEVTLMSETPTNYMRMHQFADTVIDYSTTEVAYYLNNEYLNSLDEKLSKAIKVTEVSYRDAISPTQSVGKTVDAKVFILSTTELGFEYGTGGSRIDYVTDNRKTIYSDTCWTRTEHFTGSITSFKSVSKDYIIATSINAYANVLPVFNVDSSLLVSDEVSNGYYSFIFNEPPKIQTINNIKGNFGSATNISYVATDNDDSELTHYISFDNGTKWQEIKPTRNGNIYTYSHVFNELNTYYCRVKVVDGAKNEVVSNAFTITVNAVAPTVNIVSVIDKVVTFKANCITSEISKVEILINGQNVKTFASGFDFNLVYEIDRSKLNIGKNSIQIKATSQENLVGYANLEASKTKYNLPPVGTKVIIGGIEYTISNASEDGSNQTYTLNNNLVNQVKKGDIVQVTQDLVKVLCSMSTLENVKDYKEMKLVKTKKLKGDLEGYVEEKYELQGEGRYSTVKLEMQRFNNNVSTEVLELQQYFDYLENVNIEFGGFEGNDSNGGSDGGSDGGSSENIPVTDINCSERDVTMEVGQTKQIIGNVVPSNATNKLIHWNSNNPSVATVNSSGLITAKGVGYAKVTATTDDGGYKHDIHVNVTASGGGSSSNNLTTDKTSYTINPTEMLNISYTTSVNIPSSCAWELRQNGSYLCSAYRDTSSGKIVCYTGGLSTGTHNNITLVAKEYQSDIAISNVFSIIVSGSSSGGSNSGSGGESTPPSSNSDYDARVLSLMYPMPQSHECIPNGAPSDWKYQSRWENKDKPSGWSAFGGWAQIYRVDGTPFTQNTGVEIKDYKVYGWKNGQWHSVVELPYITGNFYAEDFTDDANSYFANGIKPSDDRSSVIMRLTSDMTVSTSQGTKNVCYHPFTAQLDYDSDFEYIFTCVSMRKVKWDANGVDDMSTSRYCASCGGDWWRQKGLTWAPDWSNNKGIAQPKITEVTTEWQVFSMTTVPQGWSNGFPK